MKFGFAGRAEIVRLQGIGGTNQIFDAFRGIDARESEVRDEGARFAGKSQRFESCFQGGDEFEEIGSGFGGGPDDARIEFGGEKSERAKMEFDGLRGMNGGEGGAEGVEFFGSRIAEKFQREVRGLGANPAGGAGFGFQLRD